MKQYHQNSIQSDICNTSGKNCNKNKISKKIAKNTSLIFMYLF